MKLSVKVSTRASKNEVLKNPDGSLKVKLTAPPVDGQANGKLIELLAEEFKVAKSQIAIIKGHRAKNKIIEIL